MCRIVKSATCPLVQPVTTRWGSYLNMFQSLLKHRSALLQAVKDAEFVRLARSARAGLDNATEEILVDQQVQDLADLLAGDEPIARVTIPDGISGNKKFSAVYQALHDPKFWDGAQQYISLNEPVAAAIATLSGDSACLSDAVFLTVNTGKHINDASLADYSRLFDSEHQVADLQRLWNERAKRLSGFSHLALLLDPRPRYRAFVTSDPLIVGSVESKNVGNTDFLGSADTALRDMADLILPDNHQVVIERKKKNGGDLSLLSCKQAILSGALKAFVGVHATKKLKHLGISDEKLNQFGVDGEPPVSFWEHQVPADCLLREAGIRVMSAKPSSTTVERLWNAFGDNLTAKRRSMKNETLATVVYAKMNMFLLDCSQTQQAQDLLNSSFEDVLEFVDSVIDEELVQALGSDVEVDHDGELTPVSDVNASGSESGDAADW
jgi:hypothetical protein